MDDLINPRKGEAYIEIGGEQFKLAYRMRNTVELQRASKRTVGEIFQAIGKGDHELMLTVLMSGIKLGKEWPERFGETGPTRDFLLDSIVPEDLEEYMFAVMQAWKGAEFAGDAKKKARLAEQKAWEALENL